VPIELTTGQWISVACAAVAVIAGVSALCRNRRWFALCCGLIAAQCVVSLVVPSAGGRFMRYLFSVPLGIAVLLILRRLSDEAKLARATQTGAAPKSQP
jgi:hypothetical protein